MTFSNIYSNICENVKCGKNKKTNFCNNINLKKNKNKYIIPTDECICNLETARCIQKDSQYLKQDIDIKNQIETKKRIKINKDKDIFLTSLTPKICHLEGFGNTTLQSIKSTYPLPKDINLKYGILRKSRECIVFNRNYEYYDIKYLNEDLIIFLNNYKILIKSLKNSKLIYT
jgi:hypothetical protein